MKVYNVNSLGQASSIDATALNDLAG